MYIVTTKDSKTTLENQVLHLHINQDRRPRPPSLYPPQDLEELTAPGSGKVMRQAVSSCYADDGTARRYWQGLDLEPKDLVMKPAPLKVLFWPHLQLFCLVIMKSSLVYKKLSCEELFTMIAGCSYYSMLFIYLLETETYTETYLSHNSSIEYKENWSEPL